MTSPSPLLSLLADENAYESGRALGAIVGIVLVVILCLAVPTCLIVSIVKYSRTKTQGWLIALIISGLLCVIPVGIAVVAFSVGVYRGMKASREGTAPLAVDRKVESSDGAVQLRAAESWRMLTDLNEQAVLQVGNPAREEYLIVLSDSKVDYAGTLEEFADTCSQTMKDNLVDGIVTDMSKIRVDGHEAYRCEIAGKVDAINIDYHFTAVESTEGYHQILAWTTRSKKNTAFKVFNDVVETCQLR